MKPVKFITLFSMALLIAAFNGCGDKIVFEDGEQYNGRVYGTVHGIVTTADTNTPIEGVRVLYTVPGGNKEVRTNSNGYYRCDNLRESTYTFTFLSPDTLYCDWMEVVTVQFDSAYAHPTDNDYNVVISRNINLYSMDASVEGYVYAHQDNRNTIPASGTEVKAGGFWGVMNTDFRTVTDAEGYYKFENLPAIPVNINIQAMPWDDGTIEFGSNVVGVVLVPGAKVKADNILLMPSMPEAIVLANNFTDALVPVDGVLNLVFSRPIDESSLIIELNRVNTPVPFDYGLDEDGTTLTIDPLVLLRADTEYTLLVEGRSRDQIGFVFGRVHFMTEPGIALVHTNVIRTEGTTRDDVGLNEQLTFTFSRQLDTSHPENTIAVFRDNVEILVNWEYAPDGMTINVNPVGAYLPDTRYQIVYYVHSTLQNDITTNINTPYPFTTVASGDAPARVTGLTLVDGSGVDWNTASLRVQWNAIAGAEWYEFYGYDDNRVSDRIYLDRVEADSPFGQQTGVIRLREEFDWLSDDNVQSPFSNGINVKLMVRAVNSDGYGEFSSELSLEDYTPPAFVIDQNGTADNSAFPNDLEVVFFFTDDIEYCDSRAIPRWGFEEAGGDDQFVLSTEDGRWEWNDGTRNGTLTVTVPANTDASGDRLWISNLKDNSGNEQTLPIWIDIR